MQKFKKLSWYERDVRLITAKLCKLERLYNSNTIDRETFDKFRALILFILQEVNEGKELGDRIAHIFPKNQTSKLGETKIS